MTGSRAERRKGGQEGQPQKNSPFVGRVLGTCTVEQGKVLEEGGGGGRRRGPGNLLCSRFFHGGGQTDRTGKPKIMEEIQDHQ